MEEIQKKANIQSSKQYQTNKLPKDSKGLSSNKNQFKKFESKNEGQNYNSEIKNKINSKLNLIGQVHNGYYNEVMAAELNNLSRENSELKFCLEKLNKKFEKEMKDLKIQNSNKIKEINSSKEIIKKNVSLIELLGDKISKYEKIFKDIENKTSQKNNIDKNIKEKLEKVEKENVQLKMQIKKRDEIINNFKEEVDSKKEIFGEINKMKLEMENNLKTMDNLYQEIQIKDGEIEKLKKLMDSMDIKHKQELEKINKENINNKNIDKKDNNINDEELLKELEKSKVKQKRLEEELKEINKNYNVAKEYNNKMQELTKEASQMIKNSIDSRDKMKQEYDKAIKELIEKYEKQIQIMKVVIVEQNDKYEKQLEQLKKEEENKKEIKKEEDKKETKKKENDKEEEEKIKYLEKLKNDNIMLLNQNSELKHMNEMLLEKMKELPDLNKRFNELFETVKLLKEENDLLKKSMKDSKIMKMLEQEQENEEEIEENEKENENIENKNIEKENEEEQKLSNEELQVLESILKDIENGEDKKGEYDLNKLQILENILKKLDNKKEEENNFDNNEKGKNNFDEDNKEEDIKNKDMLNPLEDNKNKKIEESYKLNNEDIKEKEKENDLNNKIYNKKFLKASPDSVKKKSEDNTHLNKINNLEQMKKNINQEKEKSLEENEDVEEEDEEESIPNNINENFNLFKPTKEGMLSFNLSKKVYNIIIPKKYEEFLKVFDPETSVQYNTLEGLFIIPSNKTNQLFYYSSIKNTMNELFKLSENHSGGCLFLDNTTKNIIAIGGETSKKVERFSFENVKLEQLPELPEFISKMTCIQIGNIIYSFFGIIKEEKRKISPILYLDLENKKEWEEIKFENNSDFKMLYGMSCTNLNDNELLIIGGIIDDEYPNDKLMYFNLENKKLLKLDKNLPESDDKAYIFTQNSQFNLFINGDIILYANIDNNNQVHIIDNELHYDLYLTPSEI